MNDLVNAIKKQFTKNNIDVPFAIFGGYVFCKQKNLNCFNEINICFYSETDAEQVTAFFGYNMIVRSQ